MADTTTEKEIQVAAGLGDADASQVLAGATFSSESGFNQAGAFIPSAENIMYDNTDSGLNAQDAQAAIDELNSSTLKKSSVVDNLLSNSSELPLSAKQGQLLDKKIPNIIYATEEPTSVAENTIVMVYEV